MKYSPINYEDKGKKYSSILFHSESIHLITDPSFNKLYSTMVIMYSDSICVNRFFPK